MKQRLTTSIYNFEKLRTEGYHYVDKSGQLLQFLEGVGHYFLARPRRFGKSLLVTTLRAIFEGRRELFDGLAISKSDYDWKVYPVIHLELGSVSGESVEKLDSDLFHKVKNNASRLGVVLTRNGACPALEELIERLYEKGQRVVILVDEYDKPLLNHLGTPEVSEIQRALKSFYSIIKSTEVAQRFVLLTGVSKFSQVSVFSDLNNLTDLTMNREAATLLGYTQSELESNFKDYLTALAVAHETDWEGILQKVREWYNGYRFHPASETVYNPVSVMKCFQNLEFRNYWFETGTPSFLVKVLKENPTSVDHPRMPEYGLTQFDPMNLEPLALLFQTGYLTLQGTEAFGDENDYILGFPNREVERSFTLSMASGFTETRIPDVRNHTSFMIKALDSNDLDAFFKDLGVFLSSVPYDIMVQKEKYSQTLFYAVLKLMGIAIATEVTTNRGRVDAVVKTQKHIYIFEFKLDDTAQSALEQIQEKGYAAPYLSDGRKVICVGVSFDPKTGNIGEWIAQKEGVSN